VLVAAVLTGAAAQPPASPTAPAGPETFNVTTTVTASGDVEGSVTVKMAIHLDRYTAAHVRASMTDGLKYNGYPGFLKALREAPPVGTITSAGRKFTIRWANQEPEGTGRTISLVTDTPVYFVGGRRPDAKRTAGYEVAVIQLKLDEHGGGEGTMAAAARVKARGTDGVQIDNYAETPLKLTVVPPPHK
jgi:hypothetical protein